MRKGNSRFDTGELLDCSEQLVKLSQDLKYRFEHERRIRKAVYDLNAQVNSKYRGLTRRSPEPEFADLESGFQSGDTPDNASIA